MQKANLAALLGAAFFLTQAGSAHALNTRTWISSSGVDQAGCGPIANPCRTLQYAHDNTSAGGEIDVKDSAGYGSVAITKAINIIGDGSLAGVLAHAGSDAVTINAGAMDAITLRGLAIEGAGVGTNGITFTTGGTLTIANCTVQNFVQNGLNAVTSSASNIAVVNSIFAQNKNIGLLINSTGLTTASIDHTTIVNNNYVGFYVDNQQGTLATTLSNSVVGQNPSGGVVTKSTTGSLLLTVDSVKMSGNQSGLLTQGGVVFLGRSTMSGNSYGVYISSGSVNSYANNIINGNFTADVHGTLTTQFGLQ